jgi:hypothetical protein
MVTKMKKTACVLVCGLLLSVSAFSDDMKGSFIFGTGFMLGEYFEILDAPQKEIVWFEHSGHNSWINEQEV